MIRTDIQQVKQRFGIIGINPALDRAIDRALQVAPTDMAVLVTGESGVGKENFPQIIHQYSRRKHGQYIAVNCGSIPEGTIDSELFGHEKGSFTGAISDRKGYFEVASGGTLFLDEVGELPLATQARLLRVLEAGEFIKVGSSKVEKTDVRVVAATNMDMINAVNSGRFREDLYYRLNTVPIRIPALRERKDDIPLLFRKFAGDCAEKYSMPPIVLTEDAKIVLRNYRWPGNIRQLKNITEQISIIEQPREITPEILKEYLPDNEVGIIPLTQHAADRSQKMFGSEREILYQVLFDMRKDMNDLKQVVHNILAGKVAHMPEAEQVKPIVVPTADLPVRYAEEKSAPLASAKNEIISEGEIVEETKSPKTLADMEKDMIKEALERHGGNRKNAAQDLGISERTLYRKIKEYYLDNI
ncbi:MAG: sigma-54 dependent transcriptional regulator [Prevotella sp.]|nr:sigma-54 dependent transcriptional regulator [Prevotella sp.]